MVKIKVVAFNGSPRKDGNTSMLINHVLKKVEEAGNESDLINSGRATCLFEMKWISLQHLKLDKHNVFRQGRKETKQEQQSDD